MIERQKMEADLAARQVEARDLEYKIASLRDAIRDQLYPLTPVRDLRLSVVAALAAEAEALQEKYLALVGQIEALITALGR
jgi:hypothetical protein